MDVDSDLTRGPVLLSLSIITGGFALATCGLRLPARFRVSHQIGMDDYAMGVAAIMAFIGTIFSMIEGTATTSARALEFDILGQPFYLMGATLARIAICLSFITLVGGLKAWRVALTIQIFLMAIVDLTFALTLNLQCQPLEKLWDPEVVGVCWHPSVQSSIVYFRGSFAAFSWLLLSAMPVIVIHGLDLHHRALRWPFYGLSTLSLSAGILAMVQTYETSNIPTQSGVYTYHNFVATLLLILEQNMGIVAANLLHLGPLFSSRQRQLASRTNSVDDPFQQRSSGDAHDSSGDSASARTLGPLSRLKKNMIAAASGSTLTGGMQTHHHHHHHHHQQARESFELGLGRSGSTRSVAKSGVTLGRSASRISNRSVGGGADEADQDVYQEAVTGGQWPQGIIIKTVEVEVTVEESNREVDRSNMLSRASAEHDWDRMLREGPPPR